MLALLLGVLAIVVLLLWLVAGAPPIGSALQERFSQLLPGRPRHPQLLRTTSTRLPSHRRSWMASRSQDLRQPGTAKARCSPPTQAGQARARQCTRFCRCVSWG